MHPISSGDRPAATGNFRPDAISCKKCRSGASDWRPASFVSQATRHCRTTGGYQPLNTRGYQPLNTRWIRRALRIAPARGSLLETSRGNLRTLLPCETRGLRELRSHGAALSPIAWKISCTAKHARFTIPSKHAASSSPFAGRNCAQGSRCHSNSVPFDQLSSNDQLQTAENYPPDFCWGTCMFCRMNS